MAYTPVEYKTFNPREEILPYIQLYNKAYDEQEKKQEDYNKFLSSSSELLKNNPTYAGVRQTYEDQLNAMTDALSRGDLMAARQINLRSQYSKLQEGQAKADKLSKLMEAQRTAPKGSIFSHRYTEDDFDSITDMSTYTTQNESTYEKMGEALGNSLIQSPEVVASIFDGATTYLRQGYSAQDALKQVLNSNSEIRRNIDQIKASSGIEDEVGQQQIENALIQGIVNNASYKYTSVNDPRLRSQGTSGGSIYGIETPYDEGGALVDSLYQGGNPVHPVERIPIPTKGNSTQKKQDYQYAIEQMIADNLNYFAEPSELMTNLRNTNNLKVHQTSVNPFTPAYSGSQVYQVEDIYYKFTPKKGEDGTVEYKMEKLNGAPPDIVKDRASKVKEYTKAPTAAQRVIYRNLGIDALRGVNLSDAQKALVGSLGTVRLEVNHAKQGEVNFSADQAAIKIYDPDKRIAGRNGTEDEYTISFNKADLLYGCDLSQDANIPESSQSLGMYVTNLYKALPEIYGSTTVSAEKAILDFLSCPYIAKHIRQYYAYVHNVDISKLTNGAVKNLIIQQPKLFTPQPPTAYTNTYGGSGAQPAANTRTTGSETSSTVTPPSATQDSAAVVLGSHDPNVAARDSSTTGRGVVIAG